MIALLISIKNSSKPKNNFKNGYPKSQKHLNLTIVYIIMAMVMENHLIKIIIKKYWLYSK